MSCCDSCIRAGGGWTGSRQVWGPRTRRQEAGFESWFWHCLLSPVVALALPLFGRWDCRSRGSEEARGTLWLPDSGVGVNENLCAVFLLDSPVKARSSLLGQNWPPRPTGYPPVTFSEWPSLTSLFRTALSPHHQRPPLLFSSATPPPSHTQGTLLVCSFIPGHPSVSQLCEHRDLFSFSALPWH